MRTSPNVSLDLVLSEVEHIGDLISAAQSFLREMSFALPGGERNVDLDHVNAIIYGAGAVVDRLIGKLDEAERAPRSKLNLDRQDSLSEGVQKNG